MYKRQGPARACGGNAGLTRGRERAVAADDGLRGGICVRHGGIGRNAAEGDVCRRSAGRNHSRSVVVVAYAHGQRLCRHRGSAQLKPGAEVGAGVGDRLHQRHVDKRYRGAALHIRNGAYRAKRFDNEITGDIQRSFLFFAFFIKFSNTFSWYFEFLNGFGNN